MKIGLVLMTLSATALVLATPASAQKRPTGCGVDKPVTMQVLDTWLDGVDEYVGGYVLRSDGGAYVHGVGKVDARIQVTNCSNDFVVLLGLSMPARRLRVYEGPDVNDPFTTVPDFNFDRVGTVPVTVDEAAMEAYCGETSVPTNQTDDGNYGGCGVDSNGGRYVRRAVIFGWNIGSGHKLQMQQAPDAQPPCKLAQVCATSWVRVYRPSVNEWILSPEPVGGTAIAAHTQATKTGWQYRGAVTLPFRIIITTP